MSYVALYRKFRPRIFDDVKGQDAAVTTLRNQVRTGKLQHAYLFCGTRGTGKTSAARIMARAVNCEHPENGNPCNECPSCRAILSGSSMNVTEIDAASNNGVDNIRQLIEEVQYRPASGNYKVYISDEVHMLTPSAFDALLKTLEEPPSYVLFILATTEAGKVPPTIQSRCQRYDFRRIRSSVITERMRELLTEEGAEAEDRALAFVARKADGSMRDALSLLDQCMAFYMGRELTYERVLSALGEADTAAFGKLLRCLIRRDAGGAVRLFEKLVGGGLEIGQFVNDLIWYFRNLLLMMASPEGIGVDLPEESKEELRTLAAQTDEAYVMRCIRVLSDLQNTMRYASNRRVLTEIALIRLARPQTDTDLESLRERVRELEGRMEQLRAGAVPVPPPAASSSVSHEEPEEEEEGPSEVLPAAPEELREIAANWGRVVGSLQDGFLRNQLKDAVPHFKPEEAEPKLYVEIRADLSERLVADPEKARELEAEIVRQFKRSVPVELYRQKDKSPGAVRIGVEEAMRGRIAMPAEIADDEEFEE